MPQTDRAGPAPNRPPPCVPRSAALRYTTPRGAGRAPRRAPERKTVPRSATQCYGAPHEDARRYTGQRNTAPAPRTVARRGEAPPPPARPTALLPDTASPAPGRRGVRPTPAANPVAAQCPMLRGTGRSNAARHDIPQHRAMPPTLQTIARRRSAPDRPCDQRLSSSRAPRAERKRAGTFPTRHSPEQPEATPRRAKDCPTAPRAHRGSPDPGAPLGSPGPHGAVLSDAGKRGRSRSPTAPPPVP